MSTSRLAPPLLRSALAVALAAPAAQAQGLEGFRIPYDDFVLYDADNDPATENDQVRLTGQIGVDLIPFACSNWDPAAACAHALEAGGQMTGLASFKLEAEVAHQLEELHFTDPGLPPIPLLAIPLGGLEVTVSLRFLGAVQVSGALEAGASFEAALEAPFDAAFEFEPGLSFDVDLPSPDGLLTSKPELTGSIATEFTIGAFAAVEFQTAIEGIPLPSPSFLFGPEVTLRVEPLANPWWTIDGALTVYGGFGALPAGFIAGPLQLASQPLAGLDAGGAIGDPGQLDDPTWAETVDLGGHEEIAFALPDSLDPSHTLVGLDGHYGMLELDGLGQVHDAWHWTGARPHAGAPNGASTLIAGAIGSDVWLGNYAGGGAFEFSKRIEFFEGDEWRWFIGTSIVALPDGDFILGGTTSVAGNVNRRTLVRVGPDGEVQWAKMFGYGYLSDSFGAMTLTTDDAIVMVGRYDVSGSTPGAVVTKVALDGTRVWSSFVVDQGGNFRRATAVVDKGDGELLVMGHRGVGVLVPAPDFAIWSRRVDLETGDSVSERVHGAFAGGVGVFGKSVRDRVLDLIPFGGGFALVGQCSEAVEEDAWLWTLGADQNLIECAVYDSGSFDTLRTVRTMPGGGLLALGDSRGLAGATDSDLLVVRTGANPLVELSPASGGMAHHFAMAAVENDQGAVPLPVSSAQLTWSAVDYPVPSLVEFAPAVITDIEE